MRNNLGILLIAYFCLNHCVSTLYANKLPGPYDETLSMSQDTIPIKERYGDFITDPSTNPFDILPKDITQEVEYDPVTNQYIIYEKIGNEFYRTPSYMTFDEYVKWKSKQQEKEYFQKLAGINGGNKSASGKIDPFSKIKINESLIDRLFGGREVTIEPNGQVELALGLAYSKNVIQGAGTVTQLFPDFDLGMRLNLDGKIGEKMNLGFNYDTQASFDFDNKIKLDYDTEKFSEDDILKKIEAGDVSFPLQSNLIQGPQNLFGLATELQFGNLTISAVASQQRSERKNLRIEDGAVEQAFELEPLDYDDYRHFFIGHYFRDNYERALENLPFVNSQVQISNIEVWVSLNRSDNVLNSSKVLAIDFLGESDTSKFIEPAEANKPITIIPQDLKDRYGQNLPDNEYYPRYEEMLADTSTRRSSALVASKYGLKDNIDFFYGDMRRLNPNEYTYNPQLGIISLNTRLQTEERLAVSYQYTYAPNGTKVYSVGQLSLNTEAQAPTDSTETQTQTSRSPVIVKLLKPSQEIVSWPTWDLMMKNVYAAGYGGVNAEEFEFDIFYSNPLTGSFDKFISDEPELQFEYLLGMFGLDKLNARQDPQPDGLFDYVNGLTINERTGSVFYPVLEPFGRSLRTILENIGTLEQEEIDRVYEKFAVEELYTLAKPNVLDNDKLRRFYMRGKFKSSISSDISLGAFNIPQGSVTVRAGSQILTEGADYEVDYGLGRVRIINSAYLQQGVPIDVNYEDQGLFSLQQKTMLGLHADYKFSDKLTVGGTMMRLSERPLTQKVNYGEDPISNSVFGLNLDYGTESAFLTKLIDKLPFYSTNEKSSINFSAEVAALKPGNSGAINVGDDNLSVVSIDDFEGAGARVPLGNQINQWFLATPSEDLRPDESTFMADPLSFTANRALLNWFVVDDRTRSRDANDPYTRRIAQTELFNRQIPVNQLSDLRTFDLVYYPDERGPYNFDKLDGYTGYSDGVIPDPISEKVILKNPASRWAGITRAMTNTNFEQANYEYIEFWMLNPFMERADGTGHATGETGELVFHLGQVSEDLMPDGNAFFENAMPVNDTDTDFSRSAFGRYTVNPPLVNGFNRDDLDAQDVGYDGLNNDLEREHFEEYLQSIGLPNMADPANDDFVSFDDPIFSDVTNLQERYKQFNGAEGNSPRADQTSGIRGIGNVYPNKEDINNDRVVENQEAYYEYRIELQNNGGEIDRAKARYITDERVISRSQGQRDEIWYRFQIPILTEANRTQVGEIEHFRAIKFMRMIMKGFTTQKTLRLAEFDLIRNQWRRSEPEMACNENPDGTTTSFIVNQVGIERSRDKEPFGYVSPRGVNRQRSVTSFNNVLQDENALRMEILNYPPHPTSDADSCSYSVFKNTRQDFRLYDRIQMFIHAHKITEELRDREDVCLYLKLGKDFNENYYEYEVPLTFSDNTNYSLLTEPQKSEELWRDENMIDVNTDVLRNLKIQRNKDANASLVTKYTLQDTSTFGSINNVSIIGNPSLGDVRVIQIGVRNKTNNNISAEIWVNELRLAGIKQNGGVAAQARLAMQFADFGEVTMAGSYAGIGWGSIEQSVQERSLTRDLEYDIAASMSLDKLVPWANMSIPFYAQYSVASQQAKFDPYELDLTVDEVLDAAETQEERDEINSRSKEKTTIKTVALNNVRKNRSPNAKGNVKPWSPENISVSYAYTKTSYSDFLIEEESSIDHKGSIDYNYSRKVNYVQPFKKLKNKSLKILKEFNFNPLPNTFSFSTDVHRFISERKFREPDQVDFVFDDRRFDWNRRYNLIWDFTKSLKFNFSANASAVIDEYKQVGIRTNKEDRPFVDQFGQRLENVTTDDRRAFLWDNVKDFGRMKVYNHNLSLKYTLPLKYLPYMDWTNITANYNADYAWNAGSLHLNDPNGELNLGNVIQNNQSRSLGLDFDFKKLYRKSKYLKSLEKSRRPNTRSRGSRKDRNNNSNEPPKPDRRSGKNDGPSTIEKILVRPLLSLRKVKIDLDESYTTLVPGFLPIAKNFGLSQGFSAPGWDFVAGWQPDIRSNTNWLHSAADKGWITNDPSLSQQVSQFEENRYQARIDLEPWNDFKIRLEMKKTYSNTISGQFLNRGTLTDVDFQQVNFFEMGTVNTSFFSLNTIFGINDEALFDRFSNYRRTISRRLSQQNNVPNPNSSHDTNPGYLDGYGGQNRDVVIPAFMAAYTGEDPARVSLDPISDLSSKTYIPKVNWDLTYKGLSNLSMFENIFSSFELRHAYKSDLRISRFETNLSSLNSAGNFSLIKDSRTNNYYSRLNIPNILIDEGFFPLIGLDFKTTGNFGMGIQYNKTRRLELILNNANSTINGTKNDEISINLDWTIEGVNIEFLTGKKKGSNDRSRRNSRNRNVEDPTESEGNVTNYDGRDLLITFGFSLSNNWEYTATLDAVPEGATAEVLQPNRNTTALQFSPECTYDVNDNLSLAAYFDYRKNIQRAGNNTNTTQAAGGFRAIFKL